MTTNYNIISSFSLLSLLAWPSCHRTLYLHALKYRYLLFVYALFYIYQWKKAYIGRSKMNTIKTRGLIVMLMTIFEDLLAAATVVAATTVIIRTYG
jgi:hypothetical protein